MEEIIGEYSHVMKDTYVDKDYFVQEIIINK